LFRAIGIQFNSVASCAGIPSNRSERRTVSDARIQSRKRLDRELQEISDSFRFSERLLEAASDGAILADHPFAILSLFIDPLRTVLAVKGSLRRAQQRRALDRSGLF